MSTARRTAIGLALVAATLVATPAMAQSDGDEDSGWFDDRPADGVDDDAAPAVETRAARAPAPPTPDQADDATEYSDTDPAALSDFRAHLDPYGSWMQDEVYGTVWVPSSATVGAGFAPYVSAGHWAVDAGGHWVWMSDYAFGWVVFHYGRWVWIEGTGWAWVPGRVYAPAWVVWREPVAEYGYIGWAPMPPTYVWYGGYAVSLWYVPPTPYVYCSTTYVFASTGVHRHIVRDRYVAARAAAHTSRSGRVGAAPVDPGLSRIPPGARPRGRVAADPRAVAASKPPAGYHSSGPRAGRGGAAGGARGYRASPLPSTAHPARHLTPVDRSGSVGPARGSTRSVTPRAGSAVPRSSAPVVRGSSAPAPRPGTSSRGYSAPSYSRPSSSRSHGAPSYSRPAPSYSRPSAPSYSRPSYGAPSYSRPSYGAPSYSRPSYGAPSYSRPSYGAPRPNSSHSFGGGARPSSGRRR